MGSLRRHLARLIYLFDSFEAVEQLQDLVKVARSTLNDIRAFVPGPMESRVESSPAWKAWIASAFQSQALLCVYNGFGHFARECPENLFWHFVWA